MINGIARQSNYKAWWIAFGLLNLADLFTTAFALLALKGQEVNPLWSWLMGSIAGLLGVIGLAKLGVFLLLGKVRNNPINRQWYKYKNGTSVSPQIIPIACGIMSLVVVWNIGVILRHTIF